MRTVNNGDYVSIHYTGKFETGDIFDSSTGQDPLDFTAGSEELIKGMNDAVMGMKVGDKKTVTIEPERAYGVFSTELIQKVPRAALPKDVEEGDQLMARADEGQYPVWIKEITTEFVTVDANHPLAGKTLVFDIEVTNIQDASAAPPPHEHGPGCSHNH